MTLQRLDSSDGNISATPNRCNMQLTCEICNRPITAGEEYYDVQVGNGSGQVCADHGIKDIVAWTEGNAEVECAYCNATVPADETVPPASDDEAWEELAEQHAKGCEWILTRAHRRDTPPA